MTLITVALSLLILFVTGGYFFVLNRPEPDTAQSPSEAAFDSNLALWQSRRPEAFEYIVERDCFCLPEYRQPYLVRVIGNRRSVAYASPLEQDSRLYQGEPPQPVYLDDLFTLAARALRDADDFDIVYDPAFGFPTRLVVDWSLRQADEEQRFTVRDFQAIEYPN